MGSLDDDDEYITMPILHDKSFLAHYKLKNSESMGPLTLVSRHGVATSVTRCVGGRHAARTCVFTPEVSKVTIPKGAYARFILGSDGLFDVVDNEQAAAITRTLRSPVDASKALMSHVLSESKGQASGSKRADITCLVVDVNPTAFDNSAPCIMS